MRERRPLFGYGLQRSGMSAVYHSVCERIDFSIRFDTLWHSCGISTRQWKGYGTVFQISGILKLITADSRPFLI